VREDLHRTAAQDAQDAALRSAGAGLERQRDRRAQDQEERRHHPQQDVLHDVEAVQHAVVGGEPGFGGDEDDDQTGEEGCGPGRRP
jgi:hypothetical protein